MPILNLDSTEAKRHIEEINERLPKAKPEAAYALGLLSVMVFRHGVRMPAVILDGALGVKTLPEAFEYAKAVWGLRERE
jgi:hypothetical protein